MSNMFKKANIDTREMDSVVILLSFEHSTALSIFSKLFWFLLKTLNSLMAAGFIKQL